MPVENTCSVEENAPSVTACVVMEVVKVMEV